MLFLLLTKSVSFLGSALPGIVSFVAARAGVTQEACVTPARAATKETIPGSVKINLEVFQCLAWDKVEDERQTGSVLCRIALWDSFGNTVH